MNEEMKDDLRRIIDGSYGKIMESGLFLGLMTHEACKKAPEVLLQFAIAILHDKPIGLVVGNGVKVPENLKKIAFGIEYYAPDDIEDCKRAVAALMEKKGFERK